MPYYRLYRLRADDKINDALDIEADDDEAAVTEAIRIDHATFIEIWSGPRLVASVAPGQLGAHPAAENATAKGP